MGLLTHHPSAYAVHSCYASTPTLFRSSVASKHNVMLGHTIHARCPQHATEGEHCCGNLGPSLTHNPPVFTALKPKPSVAPSPLQLTNPMHQQHHEPAPKEPAVQQQHDCRISDSQHNTTESTPDQHTPRMQHGHLARKGCGCDRMP